MAAKKKPDLLQLLAEIPAHKTYSPEEKYHDFRQLFMGTEQGKRVYAEILSWSHIFQSNVSGAGTIDVNRTLVREGERNIGLKLLGAVNVEPPLTPQKQRSKPKGDSDV